MPEEMTPQSVIVRSVILSIVCGPVSTPAWSRPLADLLGAPLHAIDAGRVNAWVVEGVREGEQIDFKRELYGNGDSARRELAGDPAAFANHRGGLLILGVDEDSQGAAAAVSTVPLSDAEEGRIHQIVAEMSSRTSP